MMTLENEHEDKNTLASRDEMNASAMKLLLDCLSLYSTARSSFFEAKTPPTYCNILGLGCGSSLVAVGLQNVLPAAVHQHQLSLATQPTCHLGDSRQTTENSCWIE